MRNLSWNGMRANGDTNSPSRSAGRFDSDEIDPPAPSQILTRLGVLLMIALAFGLAAELLVRLPPH
jgi:hypothetical protein